MTKIGVLASGFGSNLQALIDASGKEDFDGEIVVVISDNPQSYALKRAEKHNINAECVQLTDFASKDDFYNEIIHILDKHDVELVLLAGFMRIVNKKMVDKYYGRMINIHPALLPSFKGLNGVKQAFEYGVKVTGVTVHFVDDKVDTGPIILQDIVWITEEDTIKTIENRIHLIEHRLFPEAVKLFIDNRLAIDGRIVHIKTEGK